MKKFSASLFLAASLAGAMAQTNVAPATRSLSLPDCIAAALQHNFDVQVQRYEPVKSLLNLNAAYAGYDPLFSLSGKHDHNRLGGAATNGFSEYNSFVSDLAGSLPSGMTYDLSGNVKDTTTAESSGGSVGATLTQPLLKNFWIDDTRLGISAAKNNLKLSEQGLRQQLIATVTAVENAF